MPGTAGGADSTRRTWPMLVALVVSLLLSLTTACQPLGPASAEPNDPESGLTWITAQELPAEGRETLSLIDAGGPFPYGKDGSTFGNFEGILPARSRGYYHEFTVRTPGSKDRGARRIITGDRDEFYWTQDHYESFRRIKR